MTDQPSTTPSTRRTPWALIIGIAMLAALALILLLLVLTRDSDGESATGSATPTPSAAASGSASASASPTATATVTAGAPPDLASGSVVATSVEGLTVRADPGLEGERLGTLEDGALSFVAGGPTDDDGFRWYLVSGLGLPPNTGCAGPFETDPFNCPIWFGWVAAASESGEPWLVPHDVACPEEPFTAEGIILGRTDIERLACFGSDPFTFRAWWPELPDDAGLGGACAANEPSGWLLCQNINYTHVTINEDEGFGGVGIAISIDPATDATMPERGTWVEVRVHLDDPGAQGCDEAAAAAGDDDRPPEQIVLDCRAEAVLEEGQAVDGP